MSASTPALAGDARGRSRLQVFTVIQCLAVAPLALTFQTVLGATKLLPADSAPPVAANSAAPQAVCGRGQIIRPKCESTGSACTVAEVLAAKRGCKRMADVMKAASHTWQSDLVVDVGLNCPRNGWFWSELGSQPRHVIGFEPTPACCKKGQNWTRAHGDLVEVHCAAVSDEVGQMTLHVPINQRASVRSSLNEVLDEMDVPSVTVSVDILTLDKVVAGQERISILKSDTQGHELKVMRGARDLLRSGRVDSIFAEFDPWLLSKAGGSGEALLGELHDAGFTCTLSSAFKGGKISCVRTTFGHKCWDDIICFPHGTVRQAVSDACLHCEHVADTDFYGDASTTRNTVLGAPKHLVR